MVKVIIHVRDNNSDSDWRQDIEASVPDRIAISLNDFDEGFDKAWDWLCNTVEFLGQDLPSDWYIDGYEIV